MRQTADEKDLEECIPITFPLANIRGLLSVYLPISVEGGCGGGYQLPESDITGEESCPHALRMNKALWGI
jgi:hypothetical protein